jgi:hypothetical protein
MVTLNDNTGTMEKPPSGVIPRWLWRERRKAELRAAINRYRKAGLKVPEEWVSEFNSIQSNESGKLYD